MQMTLIKCDECGKDISSKATSCPNCGNPMNMKSGPFGGLETGNTVRPDFWHDPNVGAVAMIILLSPFLFLLLAFETGFIAATIISIIALTVLLLIIKRRFGRK
jgi:hypothetical protein